MKTLEHNQTLTISITDRNNMEHQLDDAVAAVREVALGEREQRRGILVTRHGADKFTVALSDSVPFGLTREKQTW